MGSVDLLVCSTSRPVGSFEKALTFGFHTGAPSARGWPWRREDDASCPAWSCGRTFLEESCASSWKTAVPGFSIRLPFLAIHVQRVACECGKAKRRNTRYEPTGVRHRWSSPLGVAAEGVGRGGNTARSKQPHTHSLK